MGWPNPITQVFRTGKAFQAVFIGPIRLRDVTKDEGSEQCNVKGLLLLTLKMEGSGLKSQGMRVAFRNWKSPRSGLSPELQKGT